MLKYVCDPTHLQSLLLAGAVDESVSMYRMGLQVMEGCSTFRDDDPTLETVRTDLAELLNLLERFVIPKSWVLTDVWVFLSVRTCTDSAVVSSSGFFSNIKIFNLRIGMTKLLSCGKPIYISKREHWDPLTLPWCRIYKTWPQLML